MLDRNSHALSILNYVCAFQTANSNIDLTDPLLSKIIRDTLWVQEGKINQYRRRIANIHITINKDHMILIFQSPPKLNITLFLSFLMDSISYLK